ncbi:hypothetical protein FRC10_006997 [Ceratobasidium sp. 414]|nr:hypothetical protein FRC10_006997 [Ceratobasidium sp. 414]
MKASKLCVTTRGRVIVATARIKHHFSETEGEDPIPPIQQRCLRTGVSSSLIPNMRQASQPRYILPKAGETIYVSTGAGPVGSTVVQLTKAAGLKVIASAGSDDKVEYLKSIGVDVAFNYKKARISDVFAKEEPIDIYWNNIGGESLETAIDVCKDFARIVVCGAISAYNGGTPYGIKNASLILTKRLTIQGFIQHELKTQVGKPQVFHEKVTPLVTSGKLKWNEQVYEGLEKVGDAILDVQKGDNIAKPVVKVADAR